MHHAERPRHWTHPVGAHHSHAQCRKAKALTHPADIDSTNPITHTDQPAELACLLDCCTMLTALASLCAAYRTSIGPCQQKGATNYPLIKEPDVPVGDKFPSSLPNT
ncbi:hypothetical protein Salat_2149400 [Sesamum alatum]|uniref:Uncharacterized protein n=1 Tax=Sesamum alatum TaxID=300844 RepID=A0AAE1Y1W2_9LAMI|nr:hypothetical protein Salat_2149400 [Sesamum alatum]